MKNKLLLTLLTLCLTTTNSFTSDSIIRQKNRDNSVSIPKKIVTAGWNYSKEASIKILAGFAFLSHVTKEQIEKWENTLNRSINRLKKLQVKNNGKQISEFEAKKIKLLMKKIILLKLEIDNIKRENFIKSETKKINLKRLKLKLKKFSESFVNLFLDTLNFVVSAGKAGVYVGEKIINDILSLKIAPYLISSVFGYFSIRSSIIFWNKKIMQPIKDFKNEVCGNLFGKPFCYITNKTFELLKKIFVLNLEFTDGILEQVKSASPEEFSFFQSNFGGASKAVLAAMLVTGIVIVVKEVWSKNENGKTKEVNEQEILNSSIAN